MSSHVPTHGILPFPRAVTVCRVKTYMYKMVVYYAD